MAKSTPRPVSTVRSLAEALGCSVGTVSYALRGDARITPETRARVLAEAARQGYRANPLVAAVMAQVRAANPPGHGGVLAGLTWWRTSGAELNPAANAAFWQGATRRAEALGWRLQEVRGDTAGMTGARLRGILRARGVPGLLITPLPRADSALELAVDEFACAAWGYSPAGRVLHRACIHHGHAMALAWKHARALGFARIGLVLAAHQGPRTEHLWETNYQVQQRRVPEGGALRPLLLTQTETDHARLKTWLRAERPDVILTTLSLRGRLRVIGAAAGGLPLIDLDRTEGGPARAGVDQRHDTVGAAAIDLIVGQLHANERGAPVAPKLVLLEGRWIEGPLEGPPV